MEKVLNIVLSISASNASNESKPSQASKSSVSVSRLSSYLKKQAYRPYKHAREYSCFFIFYYGQKFQDIKWL